MTTTTIMITTKDIISTQTKTTTTGTTTNCGVGVTGIEKGREREIPIYGLEVFVCSEVYEQVC